MKEDVTIKSPIEKALQINLDDQRYGTFAEIGAGQEVARIFFLAGRASHTIAKTISAYDMTFSDEIYGKEKSGRYVCESRLNKMLAKEYDLLPERVGKTKGKDHCFFSFANTCATGDVKKSHGWMGVRFQVKPGGPTNDIILHVRSLDHYRLMQQEALGTLGVNLIHSAFYYSSNHSSFLNHLVDGLKDSRVVIDLIRVSGPDLSHFDNRLINLELVQRGIAEGVVFSSTLEVLSLSDTFYNKSVLIQRGSYSPVTKTHVDILHKGISQMNKDLKDLKTHSDLLPVLEVYMPNSSNNSEEIHSKNFLDRIETLATTNNHILVSNFSLFYKLKRLIRLYTQEPIGIVIGAHQLEKLFDPIFYKDLEGGLMEGLSKLLDDKVRLMIYPHKTSSGCITTQTFFPHPSTQFLYRHFIDNQKIEDISGCDEINDYIHSTDVLKFIQSGQTDNWKKLVPDKVYELIIKKELFKS